MDKKICYGFKNVLFAEKVTINNQKTNHFKPIKETPKFASIDISEYVDQLDGQIKTCVDDLQSER